MAGIDLPRRLIWWEAMADGMGGFFGHFSERFNAYGPFDPDGPCGYHPEPLKEAFQTHRRFWRDGRLDLTMAPANDRVRDATGYCLASSDRTRFIVFVEDAEAVTLDLNGMGGRQPVIAVDAKAAYAEKAFGERDSGVHTFHLGARSDRAIAIGRWPGGRD